MKSSMVICAGMDGAVAAACEAGVTGVANAGVACGDGVVSVTVLAPCGIDSCASCPCIGSALSCLGTNGSPFLVLVPGGRRYHCRSSGGMVAEKLRFNPSC